MKNLQLTYQHHEILMLNVVIGEYYQLKIFSCINLFTSLQTKTWSSWFICSLNPSVSSSNPNYQCTAFFKIGKKKKLQRKIFISIKFANELYNTLGHVINVENGSSRPDFFKIVATLKQCSHKIIGH